MFSQACVKNSVHGGRGSLSQHAQVTSPGGSLSSAGVSVQEEGGSLSRGVSVWWVSVQGELYPGGLCPRGLCPREGWGSLPEGVSVRETAPYGNERAVRILLEGILVVAAAAVAVQVQTVSLHGTVCCTLWVNLLGISLPKGNLSAPCIFPAC